ncbi:MAG: hypothetical protein IJR82_04665 [Bacilli bacterium]|nr:hypothetical protein [Bacilli bacterium]
MTCSSCKYLNTDKKYEGAVSGCKYYCEKYKNFIDGSQYSCDNYEKHYGRNNYTCDKICEEGNDFYDDNKSVSYYLFVLILIFIIGSILSLFA